MTVGPFGTLPPILSNITESSATIQWSTNEPSDAQVEYGLDTTYGNFSPLNAALTTSHSVVLTGLTPGKLYHHRVHSKNAGGKEAVSADITLTTPGAPGRRLGR